MLEGWLYAGWYRMPRTILLGLQQIRTSFFTQQVLCSKRSSRSYEVSWDLSSELTQCHFQTHSIGQSKSQPSLVEKCTSTWMGRAIKPNCKGHGHREGWRIGARFTFIYCILQPINRSAFENLQLLLVRAWSHCFFATCRAFCQCSLQGVRPISSQVKVRTNVTDTVKELQSWEVNSAATPYTASQQNI